MNGSDAMMPAQNTPRQLMKGFSLIELMLAVSILAILLAIALPSYQSGVRNTQVRDAVENLHVTLMFARSEAIKRNDRVLVRANEDADEWHLGWEVIGFDGADEIQLREQQPINNVRIEEVNGNDEVEFDRTGRSIGEVEFSLCSDQSGGVERLVNIAISGMARVEQGGTCP